MQLQANNKRKKVWQAARTGNSPTKLAGHIKTERQINSLTVHITCPTKHIIGHIGDGFYGSNFLGASTVR